MYCIYESFCRTVSFKNSFLPYAIKEWNKLDSEIRNTEAYKKYYRKILLNFIKPIGDSIYKIYNLLRIKLLTRLRLGFSHLSKRKFRPCLDITLLTHWIRYVFVPLKLSLHFIFFYAAKIMLLYAEPLWLI